MRKKILWAMMTGVMLAGVSLCSFPFLMSMNPSEWGGNELPYVDVSLMQPGEIITYDRVGEGTNSSGVRYLIYLDYAGDFRVFLVPLSSGKVNMPDLRWWRWGHLCEDFGPEIQDSKVVEGSIFRCRSPHNGGEWFDNEWRWSLDGTNLGEQTDDMQLVDYSLEGRHLILHKG